MLIRLLNVTFYRSEAKRIGYRANNASIDALATRLAWRNLFSPAALRPQLS